MSWKLSQVGFSLFAISTVWLPATLWAQAPQATDSMSGAAPAVVAQATPDRVDVTYANQQLIIKGNGAPLIEVLRAACKLMDAELDALVQPRDPVFGTLGPGKPKQVLETLLADAHVNYVLGGSTTDPNLIASVTISRQTEDHQVNDQVGQPETGQVMPPDTSQPEDSAAGPISIHAVASQMMELIETAKAELASSATSDQGFDLAATLQQIEAQMKAAEQLAENTPGNQQADSTAGAPSDTSEIHSPVHRTHRLTHRANH